MVLVKMEPTANAAHAGAPRVGLNPFLLERNRYTNAAKVLKGSRLTKDEYKDVLKDFNNMWGMANPIARYTMKCINVGVKPGSKIWRHTRLSHTLRIGAVATQIIQLAAKSFTTAS